MKPILVTVNTKLPAAESRINWEEGANLVIDLQYEPPVRATKWKHLRFDEALVMDFAPTGEPVLIEIRQPWETWRHEQSLNVPEVRAAGSARIHAAGHALLPLTISINSDRTVAHVSLGVGGPDEYASVASGLVLGLVHARFESPDVLAGHLAGLWILGLPRLSVSASLLRALRVVGPPIGQKKGASPFD